MAKRLSQTRTRMQSLPQPRPRGPRRMRAPRDQSLGLAGGEEKGGRGRRRKMSVKACCRNVYWEWFRMPLILMSLTCRTLHNE